MAHEDLVALLKQGAPAWNAWRAEHRQTPVDLSGAALRGLDLTRADLGGADLTGADLRGALLSEANLAAARLRDANLFKAVLDGADLERAELCGARFVHCAQLQAARHWQSAFRDEDLACGAALPRR
jgi:uncharacterized protein YjbI with pentapeptide repeats